MKIFMVGEAASHRHQLVGGLSQDVIQNSEIIGLPREAAQAADFDEQIAPEDVVISLRLRREEAAMPPFALLHVPGAGLDGIDLQALSAATTVCNVFEHEVPIAEFVLASMLHWEIRLDELSRRFSADGWPDLYRNRLPHGELFGKTIGIIGFGRIGRAIAERAKGFGMKLLAVDAAVTSPSEELLPTSDLPQLLGEADYLVIACPLTEETRDLIGEPELGAMKQTAVLINVSRAPIVSEEPLFRALQSQRLRGASLDVWYRYPSGASDSVQPADHPFHELPNVMCTPHSAAWTRELMDRRYDLIALNINAFVTGAPLRNVVRPGAR